MGSKTTDYFPNNLTKNYTLKTQKKPIPVATRSKVLAYGRSLAGIVGSISAGGMDVCLL